MFYARSLITYLTLFLTWLPYSCSIWRRDGSSATGHSESFALTPAHRRRRSVYLNPFIADKGPTASRYVGHAMLDRPSVVQWLSRELQAILLQDDVDLIAQHILGSIKHAVDAHGLRKSGQRPGQARLDYHLAVDAVVAVASPYLPQHAAQLGQELMKYVVSGLNIDAYDSVVFALHKEEEEEEAEEEGTQAGAQQDSSPERSLPIEGI